MGGAIQQSATERETKNLVRINHINMGEIVFVT